MTLFVGTSGWSYGEWKPGFYPPGAPRSRFLEHYSRILSACEINATFYRMQRHSTFVKWSSATPEWFRFTVKAHRRITHGKSIAPRTVDRSFLDNFFASVSALGDRLGAVLFQYPPHRSRDDEALSHLVAVLPPKPAYAFEFRHDSWQEPDVQSWVARSGGTLCLSETAGEVPDALPPGPFAYVRLRAARYGPEARARWLGLLTQEASSRDVYVFTKHEGVGTGDPFAGVGLAQWLVKQLLSER